MSEDEMRKEENLEHEVLDRLKTLEPIDFDYNVVDGSYVDAMLKARNIILDLYKQEKEWNQKIIKAEKFYRELYNDVVKKTNERYIPKDKIIEKIKELENKKEYCLTIWVRDEIRDFQELLED